MNFLRKQAYMRPLIALKLGDSERQELYQDFVRAQQIRVDPYQGLMRNPNDAFLTLDSVRTQ